MSIETQPRREPRVGTSKNTKVRPITNPGDLLPEGMPSDPAAERFLLGSVLLDCGRFNEVATLTPEDFSLERHRRVFRAMRVLHEAGEEIDYVTVADQLRRRDGQSPDDLRFLMSLDEGVPRAPHLRGWIGILRRHRALRLAIIESDSVMKECSMSSADPAQILADHAANIEKLREVYATNGRDIRRVDDLESVFADRSPTEYLVNPELPTKAIVCLTGDSESGKTTLACAWARDTFQKGHAVLILDRDKNPRDRVCDRLERLGIHSDGEHFRVWDCEQTAEAPQPDDPVIVNWVKRMIAETGKPPLVVLDALVNFFSRDDDENSAVDMRALFNRCRVITRLGATVIIVHHTNRNGEARGSSDFKPACDQAFLVVNRDRAGGRLLDIITLKSEKSRYGLSGSINYHYAAGKMLRIEQCPAGNDVNGRLIELLKKSTGVLTDEFVKLALNLGLKRVKAREFLKKGESDRTIRVEKNGRKRLHFWCGTDSDRGDSARDPAGS